MDHMKANKQSASQPIGLIFNDHCVSWIWDFVAGHVALLADVPKTFQYTAPAAAASIVQGQVKP
jgi:hypothetical protein